MKQQPQRRSTADDLGLADWTPTADPRPEALGSLGDALGAFLPAPAPRIVVPAQRTSTLIEAAR